MRRQNIVCLATIPTLVISALACVEPARAQETREGSADKAPSKELLLEEFHSLRENYLPTEVGHLRRLVELADQLQPEDKASQLYEKTALARLQALAALARLEPAALGELLKTSRAMKESDLPRELQAEAAFYAIQGFVLGARYEDMPEDKMRRGTQERYEAFVVDYPDSPHVPVVTASLVRNLIEQSKMDRAAQFVDLLRARFPEHRATQRAIGELFKAKAIGRPLNIDARTPDGQQLRLSDYRGQIVVLHFFDSSEPAGLSNLGGLAQLHHKFADAGLQMLGVNIDRMRQRAETFRDAGQESGKMAWPIFLDWNGARSQLIIKLGVTSVPAVYVIDREGRVVAVDPGDRLEKTVTELMESKKPSSP